MWGGVYQNVSGAYPDVSWSIMMYLKPLTPGYKEYIRKNDVSMYLVPKLDRMKISDMIHSEYIWILRINRREHVS